MSLHSPLPGYSQGCGSAHCCQEAPSPSSPSPRGPVTSHTAFLDLLPQPSPLRCGSGIIEPSCGVPAPPVIPETPPRPPATARSPTAASRTATGIGSPSHPPAMPAWGRPGRDAGMGLAGRPRGSGLRGKGVGLVLRGIHAVQQAARPKRRGQALLISRSLSEARFCLWSTLGCPLAPDVPHSPTAQVT